MANFETRKFTDPPMEKNEGAGPIKTRPKRDFHSRRPQRPPIIPKWPGKRYSALKHKKRGSTDQTVGRLRRDNLRKKGKEERC